MDSGFNHSGTDLKTKSTKKDFVSQMKADYADACFISLFQNAWIICVIC